MSGREASESLPLPSLKGGCLASRLRERGMVVCHRVVVRAGAAAGGCLDPRDVKKGAGEGALRDRGLAERAGFEPANELPHYPLSRRACSTTPAPLREVGHRLRRGPMRPVCEAVPGRECVCLTRWRRGRDSNPRNLRLLDFETRAFNRSATSPLVSLVEGCG